MSSFVAFDVGTSRCGIPPAVTREVLRATSIALPSRTPEIVHGIVDIRATTAPVLDIRSCYRIAHQPPHPSDQVEIAQAGQRTVAVRVDQVMGIEPAEAEDVAGLARFHDGLVLPADLDRFPSGVESEQFDAAIAVTSV